MKTYLIVANQTLLSDQLARAIEERIPGAIQFNVVVPLTPISHKLTWDEDESFKAAEKRLKAFLAFIRIRGGIADGGVGDTDPVLAVQDALRLGHADEILLSTFPPGRSRWLGMDVPSRLRAATSIAVTVLTDTAPAALSEPDLAAPTGLGHDQAAQPLAERP
jgi:hypothetical protein